MAKNYKYNTGYDKLRSVLVEKIANKRGVSLSYVYKVISGERENEEIFTEYMEAKEGLVRAVEQLVPFNQPAA